MELKIRTETELYVEYCKLYNSGKITHIRAYNECNIDKNTFNRIRDRGFSNIKFEDFIKLHDFIIKIKNEVK